MPRAGSRVADRISVLLLSASIFATGLSGLVSEFVLGTVSSYILGNSIEQFSIVIALMMLMMGVAGLCQRLLPDRHLAMQFLGVEVLLALIGGFAPLAIYGAQGFLEHHFLLVLYFFVAAIGFLIGFELPLVLRMNSRFVTGLRGNLSLILSLDYVGGFVGAIIWTRVLLPELPLTESSLIVAGFNFSVAAVTFLWLSRETPVARRLAAVAIVIVGVILSVGFVQNRTIAENLERRLYDDHIVLAETTAYQRIVLTENPRTQELRLYLNGNLQVSSRDEAIYHEQLVHPAMSVARSRSRVLILGGGDGLVLREVLKYSDVERVRLVELDPRMTALARDDARLARLNGDAFADARVVASASAGVSRGGRAPVFQESTRAFGERVDEEVAQVFIQNVDADRFLSGVVGPFDVVFVDLPDPSSVELSKLYSREFYRKLRRVVGVGGVAAVQATSPVHAREVYLGIKRTLESAGFAVVPYHDNVPSFGEWGFLLAQPVAPSGTPMRGGAVSKHAPGDRERLRDELRARLAAIDQIPAPTRYLTPDLIRASLAFGKGDLESRHDDVNTLLRPWLLDVYLRESWLLE